MLLAGLKTKISGFYRDDREGESVLPSEDWRSRSCLWSGRLCYIIHQQDTEPLLYPILTFDLDVKGREGVDWLSLSLVKSLQIFKALYETIMFRMELTASIKFLREHILLQTDKWIN